MSLEEGIQGRNRKDKLQEDCRETLEGIYPDIVHINCRTGDCAYIKDREEIAGKLYTEYKWSDLREEAMKKVCPEDLERCRMFTSMENLQRIGGRDIPSDTCIYGKIFQGEYCLQQSVVLPEGVSGDSVLVYTRDADESVRIDEHLKRQLFRELQKAREAELARTEFLRYADKELHAAMEVILGRLRREDAPGEGQEQAARMGRYIQTQMEDITTLSSLKEKRLPIRREVFSMAALLEDCREYAQSRAQGHNITFEMEACQDLQETYYGDPMRLMEVLFQVLANAFDYNRDGGSVRLEVGLQESGEAVDQVYFLVRDTGRGIDAQFLPRIYDKFARQCPGDMGNTRMGLGLFLGKIVMDSMGGTVRVDSQEGCGSSFRMVVPLVHVEARDQRQAWEDILNPLPKQAGEKQVLLVEDNEMNLEAAAELLQEDGYHVVGCLNGRDALQAFAHSIPGTFGLVLADVEMPGMDGEMLAEKIRELPHADSLKVPIVGMYVDPHALEGTDRGKAFTGVLGKPFNSKAFRSLMQEYRTDI